MRQGGTERIHRKMQKGEITTRHRDPGEEKRRQGEGCSRKSLMSHSWWRKFLLLEPDVPCDAFFCNVRRIGKNLILFGWAYTIVYGYGL